MKKDFYTLLAGQMAISLVRGSFLYERVFSKGDSIEQLEKGGSYSTKFELMEILIVFAIILSWLAVGASLHFRHSEKKRIKYMDTLKGLPIQLNSKEIDLGGGVKVKQDAAMYWFLNRIVRGGSRVSGSERKYEIYGVLLERLNPTDLIELAKSDIGKEYSLDRVDELKFTRTLKILSESQEWRHLSYVVPTIERKFHLDWIDSSVNSNVYFTEKYINRTTRFQHTVLPLLYCEKHLCRFVQMSSVNFGYGVCRKCKASQYGRIVEKSTLLFAQKAQWKTYMRNDHLWINGLLLDKLCDFDRIVVGECDLEHIERFCIMIGNDTDLYRQKRCKYITYKFLSDSKIAAEADILLKRFFTPLRQPN